MLLFSRCIPVRIGLLAMVRLFAMIVGTVALAMPVQHPRFFPGVAVTRNAREKNHSQSGQSGQSENHSSVFWGRYQTSHTSASGNHHF